MTWAAKASPPTALLMIHGAIKALAPIHALRDAVLDRKVLNDRFRDTVVDLQRALAGAEVDETAQAAVEHIVKRLHEALRASHRVSDLLAAEQEIGFHRGIGR